MKDVKILYKHKIMMLHNIYSVCSSTSIPDSSFCQLDLDRIYRSQKIKCRFCSDPPILEQFDLVAVSALDKNG